jgi:hypothetical protein
VNDLTYPESLYDEAELRFARWIASLGGWAFADGLTGDGPDAQVARNWLADGRAINAVKSRQPVVELTDTGYMWCRENGIGS